MSAVQGLGLLLSSWCTAPLAERLRVSITPWIRRYTSVRTWVWLKWPPAWGNRDPEACEIQTALKTLWGVSQSALSQTLQQLTAAGAVEALPRKGRDPIQYTLTGTARLAF